MSVLKRDRIQGLPDWFSMNILWVTEEGSRFMASFGGDMAMLNSNTCSREVARPDGGVDASHLRVAGGRGSTGGGEEGSSGSPACCPAATLAACPFMPFISKVLELASDPFPAAESLVALAAVPTLVALPPPWKQ